MKNRMFKLEDEYNDTGSKSFVNRRGTYVLLNRFCYLISPNKSWNFYHDLNLHNEYKILILVIFLKYLIMASVFMIFNQIPISKLEIEPL